MKVGVGAWLMTVAFCLAFLSCRQASPPPPSSHPYGLVSPTPGCLYMAFISPDDDSLCRRSIFGRIKSVITPIDRNEEVVDRFSLSEYEKLVYSPPPRKDDSLESYRVLSPTAWEFIKPHLLPTDEVWTFGYLDRGTIVVRDGRLYCLVVTSHSL